MAWPPLWPAADRVLPPRPLGCNASNPTGLECGDVVLCSPTAPNLYQQAIILAQGIGFTATDASFTHAGIYVGGGMVVDSTMATNISERPYLDMAGTSYVRALRYPRIPASLQQQLGAEARTLTGKYALTKAVVDGLLATSMGATWVLAAIQFELKKANANASDPAAAPFYCSEIIPVRGA